MYNDGIISQIVSTSHFEKKLFGGVSYYAHDWENWGNKKHAIFRAITYKTTRRWTEGTVCYLQFALKA